MKGSRVVDWLIWVTLAGVAGLVLMRRSSGPEENALAAPINLKLTDRDERFLLEGHRGKPVLIEVFASWCGACKRSAPTLSEAWRTHHDKVDFVGVTVDDDPRLAAEIKRKWAIPYDVAIDDGSVQHDYKVQLLPTLVLVDEKGMVRKVSSGSPSRSELDEWFAEL